MVHLHSTWKGEYTGKWCHNNDLKIWKAFFDRFSKKSGSQLTYEMDFLSLKVSSGFCCSWFCFSIWLFMNFVKNIFNFFYNFWLQSFNWSYNSDTMYQKRQNACVSMSLRESFGLFKRTVNSLFNDVDFYVSIQASQHNLWEHYPQTDSA